MKNPRRNPHLLLGVLGLSFPSKEKWRIISRQQLRSWPGIILRDFPRAQDVLAQQADR